MKIFATTAIQEMIPGVGTYVPALARLAGQDRHREHRLVEDPAEADMVLFLDGHQHYRDIKLNAIRSHPLVRSHRGRAFLYSELDQPWCAMPGLYVAMPKRFFDPSRQRACAYLSAPNPFIDASPAAGADLLFSFLGRGGNPARDRILRLSHPEACIEDTSAMNFFDTPSGALERQKHRYAEIISRSKFVLCPRGAGPASYRVFETMAAGRVPVILSDAWVAPRGPEWESCALFLPEREIESLPAILKSHEERFPAMASAARREWEQWFAPDVLFHRMMEDLKDLAGSAGSASLSRPFDLRYARLRARAAKSAAKQALKPLLRAGPGVAKKNPSLAAGAK